jgi:hypothetical protein
LPAISPAPGSNQFVMRDTLMLWAIRGQKPEAWRNPADEKVGISP